MALEGVNTEAVRGNWEKFTDTMKTAACWVGRNVVWLGQKGYEGLSKIASVVKPVLDSGVELAKSAGSNMKAFLINYKREAITAAVTFAVTSLAFAAYQMYAGNGNARQPAATA